MAPQLQIKEWESTDEIDRAITKLQRRISEAEALDIPKVIAEDAFEEMAVTRNVRDVVLEVFGENSPEYRDHHGITIWSSLYGRPRKEAEKVQALTRGRVGLVGVLNSLIARLQEKREDFQEDRKPTPKEITRALNLHPRIADVATTLYESGHHREAVFNASKALVNYVKERSAKHDLDGVNLMRTVFSKNNPVLAVNELQNQTEEDEQEGIMHLFEGAVLGIRNPGGHGFPDFTAQRAAEYLGLLSLLAHITQEATRR